MRRLLALLALPLWCGCTCGGQPASPEATALTPAPASPQRSATPAPAITPDRPPTPDKPEKGSFEGRLGELGSLRAHRDGALESARIGEAVRELQNGAQVGLLMPERVLRLKVDGAKVAAQVGKMVRVHGERSFDEVTVEKLEVRAEDSWRPLPLE